jgi:MFS family permease
MSMTLSVLMPVFATKILKGDSSTLGFLMAASGAGALGGALYLASRRSVLGLGIRIALAAIMYGVGLIAFSWSENLLLSMSILFITGFSMMLEMAASNTLLQTIVDEDKRGRVMSFYTMAFLGMAPLGSLLAGIFADRLGTANTIRLAGVLCICGGTFFASKLPMLRRHVRPIYQRVGILPPGEPQGGDSGPIPDLSHDH